MSKKENNTDWNEFTDGLDESLKSVKLIDGEHKKEIALIEKVIKMNEDEKEERLQNERIHRERARKVMRGIEIAGNEFNEEMDEIINDLDNKKKYYNQGQHDNETNCCLGCILTNVILVIVWIIRSVI